MSYRLDLAQRGNSLDAHRLLQLARERKLQSRVQERFLAAYFSEGAQISHQPTLVRLAAEAGLDADEAFSVLNSDAYTAAVRADEQRAAALGIKGIPFMLIDEHQVVSGAQSRAAFRLALNEARR